MKEKVFLHQQNVFGLYKENVFRIRIAQIPTSPKSNRYYNEQVLPLASRSLQFSNSKQTIPNTQRRCNTKRNHIVRYRSIINAERGFWQRVACSCFGRSGPWRCQRGGLESGLCCRRYAQPSVQAQLPRWPAACEDSPLSQRTLKVRSGANTLRAAGQPALLFPTV